VQTVRCLANLEPGRHEGKTKNGSQITVVLDNQNLLAGEGHEEILLQLVGK
jgi:hypothetical protein